MPAAVGRSTPCVSSWCVPQRGCGFLCCATQVLGVKRHLLSFTGRRSSSQSCSLTSPRETSWCQRGIARGVTISSGMGVLCQPRRQDLFCSSFWDSLQSWFSWGASKPQFQRQVSQLLPWLLSHAMGLLRAEVVYSSGRSK